MGIGDASPLAISHVKDNVITGKLLERTQSKDSRWVARKVEESFIVYGSRSRTPCLFMYPSTFDFLAPGAVMQLFESRLEAAGKST